MNLSNATVLITGGAGLVGSALATKLLEQGADVRVVDDLSKDDRNQIPDGATFFQTDLTNADNVADVLTAELDVVFHFAAYTDTNFGDDRKLFEENTEMTYNVLERMHEAGVDNFVFTSSSIVLWRRPTTDSRRLRST